MACNGNRRSLPLLLFIVCMIAGSAKAFAVIEIAPLSNEELEQRYRVLIEELRCPKCQNQNLAASNSPISVDLRAQIRTMLEEGKSDEEIVAFLVDRYGEFVRYRPEVKSNTLVLWFAPGLIFLVGVTTVLFIIRKYRKPQVVQSSELSNEEKRRLESLTGFEAEGREENK